MPFLSYQEFTSPFQTGGTVREDLLNEIYNLSPQDHLLFDNLSSVQVNAGYVEHLEDTLRAAAVNAWGEGLAATDVNLSTASRVASIVQNFQAHFWVSGRQQAVLHAGMSSALAYLN